MLRAKSTRQKKSKPVRAAKKEGWVKVLYGLSVVFLVWIVITTFSPMPIGLLRTTGWLCPRVTVCAEDMLSIALLAVSRSSAYFCYPLIMLLFISKTNNLRTLLARTPISMFVPLYDLHQMHVFCGKIVAYDVIVHGFCHLLRWGLQGRINLLWGHVTGRSGAISLLITPLVAWPMLWPSLKKNITWEIRKGLHYLSVVWGIAILFHAPKMQISILIGIPVFMYIVDYVYGYFGRTYLIEKSHFTRLECGVELRFHHPDGFKTDGTGYIMVCVPWISRWEWHAFSLFAHPEIENHSCVCMCMNGDWTVALHEAVKVPTTRPVFVAGPFASPYATALNYDNVILVASGIGITPALSIITTHKESKRVNLIWACREPSLIEFYLKSTEFDDDSWTLIYYTGKRRLVIDFDLPKTVFIFHGRPNLKKSILEIVAGIELETGLPESVMNEANNQKQRMRDIASQLSLDGVHDAYSKFSILLKRSMQTFSAEEIKAILSHESDEGVKVLRFKQFKITDILDQLMPDAFTTDEVIEIIRCMDTNGDGEVSMEEFREACYEVLATMNDDSQSISDSFSSSNSLQDLGRSVSTDDLMEMGRHCVDDYEKTEHEVSRVSMRFGVSPKATKKCHDSGPSVSDIPKGSFKNWGLLYCGGSQPVVDELMLMANKTGMSLRIEKFDW